MANLMVRSLGVRPYSEVWQDMREFTQQRTHETADELWLLQHTPVFTQGQAGKAEHILNPHQIPVIQTDRGGQVTYHGPGQLVAYPLLDISRQKLTIRGLVTALEKCVIDVLAGFSISAQSRCDAPGVYVGNRKICSIGLRVRRGCSFHGIALNVAMDLKPFSYINPCGFQGLAMAQMSDFVSGVCCEDIHSPLLAAFRHHFGYTAAEVMGEANL
jgi:lipoyl(octanoyl) transferase